MQEDSKKIDFPGQQDSWRKLLLEQALDAVIAIDANDIIIDWNQHAEIIFGYAKEEALGKTLAELIIPEQLIEAHHKGMEVFFETGLGPILNKRIEVSAKHRTGCVFPVELTVIPMRVEGKQVFYSFLRDISDRKRAEEGMRDALNRTEALQENLDAIFSQVAVGIAQVDLTGKFELVNDRYCELLGRPKEEVLTLRMQDVTHPKDLEQNIEKFKDLLAHGKNFTIEKRYLKPDGSLTWVNNSVSLIKNKEGKPTHVVAVSQDISKRIAAQEHARESEERFKLMVEAVEDYAIFMLNPEGNVISWNSGAAKITGYSSEEVVGKHFSLFYPKEADKNAAEMELETALRKGHFEEEGWRVRKDGTYFWANVVVRPVRNAEGKHIGFSKVTRDLTERRKAQEVLKQRDERLDLAQRAGRLGTFEWNILSDKISWSKELILLYGKDLPELPETYQQWLQNVHPDDQLRVDQEIKKAFEQFNEINVELRMRLPDGSYRWLLTRADIFRNKSGRPVRMVGVKIDVSEKKRIEEEREELLTREKLAREEAEAQRTRLYSLFMQAPVAVCIYQGPEFIYEMVNPVYVEIIGDRDYIGKKLLDAVPEVADQPVLEVLKRTFSTGEAQYGNEFPIQLLQPNNEMREGFYNFVFQPLMDNNGRTEGIFVLGYEVTDHVISRNKLEQYAEDLQNAVHARDEFLSVASHELKTPLTSLKLQTQIRQKAVIRGNQEAFTMEKMKKMFEGDARQIERLARLIDDMLDISRISTGRLVINREEVDLKNLVQDFLERFEDSCKAAGCEIRLLELHSARGFWDPFRIEQVLANVLNNAIKYAPGMPVSIKLTSTDGKAVLSIKDQGKGIAKEDLERVFQRFERATSANEVSGLGLGLFISRQIVELHGGRMWVQSEPEEGADFFIELPLAASGSEG